jgi:DNA invertase Pin-like site-specific DNA recombinase
MSKPSRDSKAAPPAGRLIGYARVSTAEQNTRLQRDALERAGCVRLFVDEDASGASRDRPVLTRALRYLRPGDTLVVWKLDRLARSLQDLLDITEELRERGIGFESLTEKLDTASAYGEFIFHVIAAIAHMERRLIAERTHAGLDAARSRGVQLGRPRKLDEHDVRDAHRLVMDGTHSLDDIAARYAVSGITLTRAFTRHGLAG